MAQIKIRDRDIITKSFRMLNRGLPPSESLDILNWGLYFNVFSSATGDNRYINPIPQWSPATDPRYGRLLQSEEGGFGEMYKKVYEDNVTLLTITPGTAQFAGLLSFITNMFNPAAAIIANKGRAPGAAFYLGQAYGATAFWPMQLLSISTQFLAFLMDSPRHEFWTVKPAMGAFTMAASGVLNDLLLKSGYTAPLLPKRNQEQTDPLHGLAPDYDNTNVLKDLSALAPDCVNADGTVDLMRWITRGARKHRVMLARLAEMDKDTTLVNEQLKLQRARQIIEEVTFDQSVTAGNPSQEFVEKEMNSVGKYRGDDEGNYSEQDSAYLSQGAYQNMVNEGDGVTSTASSVSSDGRTLSSILDAAQQTMSTATSYGTAATPPFNPNERAQRPSGVTPQTGSASSPTSDQIYYRDNTEDRSWAGDVFDLVNTAITGGLDALTFRVEGHGGAVSDSYSNSSARSPLAEKLNSVTRQANDLKFDIASGNTGIDIIDGIVNTIKDGVSGVLSGSVIGMPALMAVSNTFVKVPNHWAESSASLHSETYEIVSRCNYAHPYEIITKIWIPFSLCLPLVSGFSAGGASSTTPFYVKTYCKSRQIIRHGLVRRLNFKFGEGPNGFTRDRKPLNLTMSLEVEDLAPWCSIPIDRSMSILDLTNPAAAVSRVLSDDSGYNSMTSRAAGVDYLDTILRYSRLNLGLTQAANDIQRSYSAENMAAKISDSVVGDLMRIFQKPLAR